jgi:hypothetical protein
LLHFSSEKELIEKIKKVDTTKFPCDKLVRTWIGSDVADALNLIQQIQIQKKKKEKQ